MQTPDIVMEPARRTPVRGRTDVLVAGAGPAGAMAALALYARATRDSFLRLGALVAAVLPLGHAFGRLGCFMHGCCYGRISHAACAVRFPRHSPAW